MFIYLLLLMVACSADIWTTELAARAGGGEANPVARLLSAKIGVWPARFALKAVIVAVAMLINVKELYVVLAVLHYAAATWNLNVARKLRATRAK